MNEFEKEIFQANMEKVLNELIPQKVPTEYILLAHLKFIDGSEMEVSGEELSELLKEYLQDPDKLQITEVRAVINLESLKKEITRRQKSLLKGIDEDDK